MAVYFDNIIGNEKLKRMLSSYVQNENMPHAFILEGARGSGKKTIAKSVAAALSCKNETDTVPCNKCINCEKIFKGVSPDVILIDSQGKKSIGVDIIRELKNHTYITSNELDYKAYIIDEADKMTPAAQNAFLKILEEPVTNVLYFLLCENAQKLLPTVISRAPVIRTARVEKQQIINYLTKNTKLDTEDIKTLTALSGGNIGVALEYSLDSSQLSSHKALRADVYRFLELNKSDVKKHLFLSFISEIEDKGGYCTDFLLTVYTAARDLVLFKTSASDSFDFFIDINDIKKYEKYIKLKYAKKLCVLIEEALAQLQLNTGASSASTIMQNLALKAWNTHNL